MHIIQFLNENASLVIALAVTVQATFTVILVKVYVKRQTKIMEAQRAVFVLQLYFSSKWNTHTLQRTFADEFIQKCEEERNMERLYKLALGQDIDA